MGQCDYTGFFEMTTCCVLQDTVQGKPRFAKQGKATVTQAGISSHLNPGGAVGWRLKTENWFSVSARVAAFQYSIVTSPLCTFPQMFLIVYPRAIWDGMCFAPILKRLNEMRCGRRPLVILW